LRFRAEVSFLYPKKLTCSFSFFQLVQSTMEKPDEMKMESLVRLLDEILEVQLTPEKKTARRKVIENALVTSLGTSLLWTASDACIHGMVIPFLQFEVKLLRRRNVSSHELY